jgi:ATP/maltotriose-dependent transcriptional regulator MalT/DNA-binding SARP family transcriptional activator
VARERLFAKLDEAREHKPAICVVGPPGAGKTTLVASWLDARGIKGIWYQVDPGDAEVATFFHYLVQAAKPFLREAQRPLPLLTPEYAQDVPGFARRFFRDLFASLPKPSVLVLDNFQETGLADVFHTVVVEATEQLPEHVRLIIVSRVDPPVHYARLIANESLALVEWDALRLTIDETRGMAEARGPIDDATLASLHQHSNGWAAGVTLMMERLRRTGEVNRLAEAASLDAVFNYFASQLFSRVPTEKRRALMKCALFQSVNARLAVAITGNPEAGTLLDDLYRRHLFLDRRYEVAVMYQFHALFRAFLLHQLEQEISENECNALKRRAAVLLESENRMDEAQFLYAEARDWAGLTALVLREAPAVLGQGRSQTLRDWIEVMPQEWITENPWLTYWLGESRLGEDLRTARAALELAHAGFRHRDDIVGQIVAIAGIMETHYFFWSLFPVLDPWIVEMCALLDREPVFPSAEFEMRAYGALLMATHHRAPRNPWLPIIVERMRTLLSAKLSDDRKVRAACMLLGYAQAGSNLSLGHWVVTTIEPIVERAGVTPLSRCMWLGRVGLHLAHKGDYEEAINTVDQAEALARDNGIAVDVALRSFWSVLATLGGGDLTRAEAFVRQLETVARPDRPLEAGMAHYCRCMLALAQDDSETALESGRAAIRIADKEDAFWPQVYFTGSAIYAMLDGGHFEEGAHYIAHLRSLVAGTFLAAFEAELQLCEAALALASENLATCHFHLREACRIARSTEYLFVNRAMPRPLRRVLGEALRTEIEPEYFRGIIRHYGLWPGPEGDTTWPWPLRIRLLGQFELLVDGAPPLFSRKMPRKTLALLCVIVAFGGKDVAEERILDALWPEEEADAAYRSLTATVRRLREMLGRRTTIRHSGGKLSINPFGCWVDTWAFEQALASGDNAVIERAIEIYRGNFLPAEDAPWAVPMRERLRSKFIQAVLEAGKRNEQASRHEQAIRCYLRGLDADNLVEAFYQGLMRCYGQLQRRPEAASIYRRLRDVLSVTLGVAPSSATEQLYQRLRLN